MASNALLQERNRGLQRAKAGLEQARDRAQTRLTQLQRDLIRTQADLTQARADLKQVQGSALRVAESMRAQSERGQELATGTVVVHMGEELARRVIPAGAPAEVVRGTLQGLLNDAEAVVAHRVERPPGRARRVCLDPHGEPANQIAERTVMALMTESHPIDGQIPAVPLPEIHPLVVRAVASQNATAESTDPVEVDVAGQVNRLAFRRG